jgi:DNA-binding NtrC family response regulator
MELSLPPLRARGEDISLLTAAFVRDSAARMGREITGVTTAAERILQQSPWDGNVRELRNVIERACLLSDGRILSERDVVAAMRATSSPIAPPAPVADLPVRPGDGDLLSTAQRDQIDRVLKRANGNKSEAARLLGISRRSLYRWLERLELTEGAPGQETPPAVE